MILIENTEVLGWEHAIRGMRNPLNSWDKSDSEFICTHDLDADVIRKTDEFYIGDNDLKLMNNLAKAGSDHAKYKRMITVYTDILAPLYWWKEFDTYKVGTVANSCSTMHKIHDKEFTEYDFSCEKLTRKTHIILDIVIRALNNSRLDYLTTKDKSHWWQMIQLLPSSYNQRRTVQLNYEVLANMYKSRKNHKLDEWCTFCKWVESLPYAQLITGEVEKC